MADAKLTPSSQPYKGDDRDYAAEKNTQIRELQDAVKTLTEQVNTLNRRA